MDKTFYSEGMNNQFISSNSPLDVTITMDGPQEEISQIEKKLKDAVNNFQYWWQGK